MLQVGEFVGCHEFEAFVLEVAIADGHPKAASYRALVKARKACLVCRGLTNPLVCRGGVWNAATCRLTTWSSGPAQSGRPLTMRVEQS